MSSTSLCPQLSRTVSKKCRESAAFAFGQSKTRSRSPWYSGAVQGYPLVPNTRRSVNHSKVCGRKSYCGRRSNPSACCARDLCGNNDGTQIRETCGQIGDHVPATGDDSGQLGQLDPADRGREVIQIEIEGGDAVRRPCLQTERLSPVRSLARAPVKLLICGENNATLAPGSGVSLPWSRMPPRCRRCPPGAHVCARNELGRSPL